MDSSLKASDLLRRQFISLSKLTNTPTKLKRGNFLAWLKPSLHFIPFISLFLGQSCNNLWFFKYWVHCFGKDCFENVIVLPRILQSASNNMHSHIHLLIRGYSISILSSTNFCSAMPEHQTFNHRCSYVCLKRSHLFFVSSLKFSKPNPLIFQLIFNNDFNY